MHNVEGGGPEGEAEVVLISSPTKEHSASHSSRDVWLRSLGSFTGGAAILLCGASVCETRTNRHSLAAQNARAVTCGVSCGLRCRESYDHTRPGWERRLKMRIGTADELAAGLGKCVHVGRWQNMQYCRRHVACALHCVTRRARSIYYF
jgi:hypothetical protein